MVSAGSIKLRSFAGRSLFTGFFSAPVTRKRGGVEHILKAFPDSRFFLIGDSGEHDMELYAQWVLNSIPRVLLTISQQYLTPLQIGVIILR